MTIVVSQNVSVDELVYYVHITEGTIINFSHCIVVFKALDRLTGKM